MHKSTEHKDAGRILINPPSKHGQIPLFAQNSSPRGDSHRKAPAEVSARAYVVIDEVACVSKK